MRAFLVRLEDPQRPKKAVSADRQKSILPRQVPPKASRSCIAPIIKRIWRFAILPSVGLPKRVSVAIFRRRTQLQANLMPTLIAHRARCRRLLCQAAKRRKTITYGALAMALGLKSPRQAWSTVLGPIAANEVNKTGRDLTLIVVYASGPAKDLGRYFSNIRGGAAPQSGALSPRSTRHVAAYKRERERVFNRYATIRC
jgi:hypothetical protein